MTNRYLLRIATPLTLVSIAAVLGQSFDGSDLDLHWHTIDSGGGSSAGGGFELIGTIGQPDVGVMSGGDFILAGGFWGGVAPPCLGDLNKDGVVNSVDLTLLLACFDQQAVDCPHQCDINGDGKCNSVDLTLLLGNFGLCQ